MRYELTLEEDFNIWKQLWTARKKRPCEYYEVRAGHGARNIPKETLKLLNEELKVPVYLADSPLTCVVEGTGVLLENIHLIDSH